MINYYSGSLNSNRLQKCYAIGSKRVQKFLEAEIAYVLDSTNSNDTVLDLGCGYGRVTTKLLAKAKKVVGIDLSKENIQLAREIIGNEGNCELYEMNANDLKFEDCSFSVVICIQNGISAFKIDPSTLVKEAIRVTRTKGILLFSSYSEKFWAERLEWFRIQAAAGLIGEIDETLTKNGTIVCKDGFKAVTFSAQEFLELASGFNRENSPSACCGVAARILY